MSAKNEKWRKAIYYEKVNNFNNSKPGIIIGFILVALYLSMGITFSILNIKKGHTDGVTMFCCIFTLGMALFAIIIETLRSKRYIKRKRASSGGLI
jgi:tryptophan-rich sensory protein